MTLWPKRRKARHQSACPRCGRLITIGALIYNARDRWGWVCHTCQTERTMQQPPQPSERGGAA